VESNEFDPEMYDLVCDVRSPSEYNDDHVPFAISTPVLNDQQREEIGTMYVQVDPFEAKKLGAKLTSENLSKILEEHFLHLPKTTKVCVYCFRGGERSLSLAHVLSRIGFDVSYVPGGYKKYRETTLKYLKEEAAKFRYHVVAGKTGCAKGKLLDALEKRGAQVIDLERFAEHRGSVLGEDPENGFVGQPSQKMFDSRLAHKMRKFDEKRVIFVEGESSMIGKVQIPTMTWKRMGEGKATILSIPMEHRVKWIRQNYEHFETTEVPRLLEKLQVLEKRVGNERVNQWRSLVAEKKWDQFVEEILVHHYDRAYDQASKRSRPNDFDEESGERKGADQGGADELFLENLEEQTYDKAAEDLMEKYDKVL
jgi:tRNA 2-selenouridine synthase